MSEIVKILMEFVKGRKANSDLLYRWLACAAAMLTIAACIRHQRPSDVLAEVMRISGFDSASVWLATSLPPALALPNQTAQQIVLLIAEILVLAMLFLPFVVAQQEKRPVGWQAQGLLGARAPSTVWVLLVVASQLWPLNWFAIWSFSAWFLLVVAALIVVRLFYLTARLLQFRNHLTSGSQKLPPLVQDISKVVSMAIASLVLAAIAPLIEMIIWAGFVESDFFFEANFRLEKDKGGYRQPTGAKSIQVNEK